MYQQPKAHVAAFVQSLLIFSFNFRFLSAFIACLTEHVPILRFEAFVRE